MSKEIVIKNSDELAKILLPGIIKALKNPKLRRLKK